MKKFILALVLYVSFTTGFLPRAQATTITTQEQSSASSGQILAKIEQGGTTLSGAPDYDWWYGCSPTSAGMMMGYYDNKGYGGFRYDNLVPGGLAELNDYSVIPGTWTTLAQNAIASPGHVAAFYSGGYNVIGDDNPALHTNFDSLADFMGTSQDSVNFSTSNGGTWFYAWDDGSKFTAQDAFNSKVYNSDGMYGLWEYFSYAGYNDPQTNFYTQLTDNQVSSGGFNFDDYKAEINAGRVVMLQVEGHSMLGYGYNETGNTVYLHDTWSLDDDPNNPHSMTWGGSYSGMKMLGVTTFIPQGGTPVPEPATMLLLGLGLIGIVGAWRRFKEE